MLSCMYGQQSCGHSLGPLSTIIAVLGALSVYAYHRHHRRQQAGDPDPKAGLDSLVIPPPGGPFGGGGDGGQGPGHYSWAAGATPPASVTPAGSSLGTGCEHPEVAVHGTGPTAVAAATAAANRGLGPLPFAGTELSTLPSVVEDVDDRLATLAPIPTCPAGTSPMSLASLQAAVVGAAAGAALVRGQAARLGYLQVYTTSSALDICQRCTLCTFAAAPTRGALHPQLNGHKSPLVAVATWPAGATHHVCALARRLFVCEVCGGMLLGQRAAGMVRGGPDCTLQLSGHVFILFRLVPCSVAMCMPCNLLG